MGGRVLWFTISLDVYVYDIQGVQDMGSLARSSRPLDGWVHIGTYTPYLLLFIEGS